MGVEAQQNKKSPTYSWVIENLTETEKKNRNSKSWPFKVVKRGDPQFKCITSLSDLENSFNNTKYTKSSELYVDGRYGRILSLLSSKLGKKTENIKFLYINLDTIFYMDDVGNLGQIKYGNQLTTYLQNIVYGLLYSSDIIKEALRVNKQMYDNNTLYALVKSYIESRVNMRFLSDEGKYITDIFKSDISFRNVEYLVFSATPLNAVDYNGFVKSQITEFLTKFGIQATPKLMEQLANFVSLNNEVLHMSEVKNRIESGAKIEGIGKVKYVTLLKEAIPAERIKNYFISLKSEDDKKELEEKNEKLKSLLNTVEEPVKNIFFMIQNMNLMNSVVEQIDMQGVSKHGEYTIWITGNYTLSALKNRLNQLYNIENLKHTEIPIINILTEVVPLFIKQNGVVDELKTFDSYLPDNFKNDTHTFKSYGCSFETQEGLLKVIESVKEIQSKVFHLYETYLGLQYAMFGVYMSRYGCKNAWLAKMKVKELDEKYTPSYPLYTSSNVRDRANKAFYLIKKPANFLNGELAVDEIAANMGDMQYFVKYYMDLLISEVKISYSEDMENYDEEKEKYVKNLTYSQVESSKQDVYRMQGLLLITKCIFDILKECGNIIGFDLTYLLSDKCQEIDERLQELSSFSS